MQRTRFFSRSLFGLVVSLLAAVFVSNNVVYAGQFYPDGYQRCLESSGGRQNFHSVQYACSEAVEPGHGNGQNACASWLGSSASSTSQEVWIYVTEGQTSAPIYVYGMCTDIPNTSAEMYTLFDGGSISIGNFTRGAPWGNVTSRAGTINIPAFKNGANVYTSGTTKVYWRVVGLIRGHSDAQSYDYDTYRIYIVESEAEPQVENLCQAWMPSSYPDSNENSGTTSMVVKAINTAGRFPAGESGDWHHDGPGGLQGPIYAMPSDNIRWHSCYYPGIQTTARTEVSDINGVMVNGGANGSGSYEPYESLVYEDTCMGYNPVVGYKQLYVGYNDNFGEWQNKYWFTKTEIAANNVHESPEFGPGEYQWRTDFERDDNRSMGQTKGNDVGRTLTQEGITGFPRAASIGGRTPSHDVIRQRPVSCYTDAEIAAFQEADPNWEDPIGCVEDFVLCTNSFANAIKPSSVDISQAKDSARVIVPYNYQNTTSSSIKTNMVYSGETVEIGDINAIVGQRNNATRTYATYATVVPKAEMRLFMYVSAGPGGGGGTAGDATCDQIGGAKQCLEVERTSLTDLNSGGNLGGSTETIWSNKTYNAFDASAGDYICFVAAINPEQTSGDEDTGEGGNGQWQFGNAACKVIYKKPTFQVWGSSMYVKGGKVDTNIANKRYLYNNYYSGKTNLCKNGNCFKPTSYSGVNYFGSWVEEGLILNTATTSTLASGAAFGYASVNNFEKAGNSTKTTIRISPLTFSNIMDTAGTGVGNSGIGSKMTNNPHDLIDYWIGDLTNYKTNMTNLWGGKRRMLESASGRKIYYIDGTKDTGTNSNITIGSYNVPSGTTYLIKTEKNVTINGNLKYQDPDRGLISNVPKVVIYASNVDISCNVDEVDAIIIATGTVNTCYNGTSDVNASIRSRRLKVFGVVVANSVKLERTYGVAAWNGSMNDGRTTDAEAAEVFDYDSTIPMWSEFMGSSAETDTLQIVYQHELAPRY